MIPMAQAAFKTEYDKLFIGGKWVAPSTERVIEVYSPATGEYVGKVPWASAADVDAACTSARSAFDHGPWPRMTPEERQGVLANAVKLINDRADEFKFLLKAETGQPQLIVDMMQYGAALSGLQYYSGAAEKFTWKDIRDGIYGQTLVLREPVGVVGAVVAWNVPLFLACNKLGPALIAGCTMVLKPAAETPLTINALAAVFATRPRDHWVDLLGPADTCVAPVNTVAEAVADPHTEARGLVVDAVSATDGPFRQSAPGWAGTVPPEGAYEVREPTATDTERLLVEAGLDGPRVDDLLQRGVIA